ncbi:MAG: M23 family metallopeptidase [Bacilli bacterium]|nr:M23 family metallopeptidase [Bacilli bacterium]
MNKKNRVIAIALTFLLAIFVFVLGLNKPKEELFNVKYQVYLDGKSIGLINNSNELYNLINQEQSNIKDEYNVDQVYPPKGFAIEKYVSYDNNEIAVNDVYNRIKNVKSFTIKGYTATVASKPTEENEAKVLFRINVLDKKVFEEAIQKLINSFISSDRYTAYINDSQLEIKDTGSLIENIYFEENITIKETYLSTEDKIYTDSDSLAKYLMFGDKEDEEYTVKKGDTIKSIADAHELNPDEFLIANTKFKDANNMLAIGEKVNVTLIKPQLTLVEEEYIVEDTEVKYDTEIKYDNTKPSNYRSIDVEGKNGIQRVAKRIQIVNGAASKEAQIDQANTYMLREVVNEVITRGNKTYNYSNITGKYYDDGSNWAWPTNYPYTLSSGYGWRWGAFHAGQDITGTGYGSPIYSIGAGTVISAGWGGMVGDTAGYNIVIDHHNGYYSVYAHLSDIYVKKYDEVKRKQKIGAMGKSGVVTGTHLHLTISVGGPPYRGGKFIDPMILWSKK